MPLPRHVCYTCRSSGDSAVARVKGFGVILNHRSGRGRRFPRCSCAINRLAILAILCPVLYAAGQEVPTTPAGQTPLPPVPESTSRDELAIFKVKVNVVLVRVVVRDAHGNAVGGVHQEDFQLFDNGKPQTIRHFAEEVSEGKSEQPIAAGVPAVGSTPGTQPRAFVIPTHFVAYVFDDVHIDFSDLVHLRDAAKRHVDGLRPTDRAAIFTTSGRGNLDFTSDHAALQKALDRIQPTVASRTLSDQCPDISYYMADLIRNKQDSYALALATADALQCAFQDHNTTGRFSGPAEVMAQNTAARVLMEGDHESQLALSVFQDVLRRIADMPGQRTILVLSPGF